jgi:hypothetical protein
MMADRENRANWRQPDMHHWSEQDWRKFITPDKLPDLRYWQPGEALPEYQFTNHLANFHKRAAQRFTHAFCLPLLDRLRPKWPEETYPQKIPDEVVAELERKLRD